MDNRAGKNKNSLIEGKAWLVAVDMGYGHQRTAYPLRNIAFGGRVINANSYKGIPAKDERIWKTTRSFYEFISKFRKIPFLGEKVFQIMDSFQKIMGYYPKREQSRPNLAVRNIFFTIKKGWGRDLIEKIRNNPLPFISTFFTPAFMAEELKYRGEIYCVICDADIARAWVSLEPSKSRIKYLVPCTWARDRLKLYGIKPENIILTGYPLPKENLGGENLETLKNDLRYRLLNLDPRGLYRKLYGPLIKNYLEELPKMSNHPLTLMFSIGGAGAQKEIAVAAINGLAQEIKAQKIRVIVSVGIKEELKKYFEKRVKGLELDGWVRILAGKNINDYFEKFNQALRTTDILWTKPSELTFYAALGLPVIFAPTLGSQEEFNKRWLLHIGAGVAQENPKYANQWIFDLLNSGDLAEMAMQGFVEMEKMGTYNIEKIIASQ